MSKTSPRRPGVRAAGKQLTSASCPWAELDAGCPRSLVPKPWAQPCPVPAHLSSLYLCCHPGRCCAFLPLPQDSCPKPQPRLSSGYSPVLSCPAAPGHFSLHLSCQPLQAPRGHNEVTLKLLFRSPAFPCSSSNHSSNIFFLTARNSSPFLPAGLLQLLGKERQVTNILTGKSPMFMRCKETQFTGKCIPDVQPCSTVSDKITLELRC